MPLHAAPLPIVASALHWAVPLAVAGLLLSASLFDIGYRLIPDLLPGSIALIGLVQRLAEGPAILAVALVASLLVLLVLGLLAVRGVLGGGDVKLAAACALVLPLAGLDDFLLATALAGGVLALVYIVLGSILRARRDKTAARSASVPRAAPCGSAPPAAPRHRLTRFAAAEARRIRRGGPLPYAVAIAAGALFAAVRPNGLAALL